MSSQTKFLISMLFIVVIIFCVVLTRFYFDVTKNTESDTHSSRIDSIIRSFGDMQVFRSVNGGYGLLDADMTVLIEPEWLEILDVTENLILVSGRLNDTVLIGGIDYEENIVLPFVFRSVQKLGDGYHLAIVEEDSRCIVYDRNYQPAFQESFASVSYYNKLLTLETENDCLYYDMSEQPPALRRAEFSCKIAENLELNWKIANQVYLAELHTEDLRRINQIVSAYLLMLQENDFSNLSAISSSEYFNTLAKPDSFTGILSDHVSHFSFSRRESGAYDFTFTISYHQDAVPEEKQMQIHLYFRKNAENQMILTAADLTSAALE